MPATNNRIKQLPVRPEDPERAAARRTPPPAFAQTALLYYEDPAEFETLRSAYIDEHLPATPTEHFFINEMANAQWRLRRLRLIEADLIRIRLSCDPNIDGDAAQAEAVRLLADTTKATQILLRQEAALRRQYERALKMFWDCRERREKRTEHEQKSKQPPEKQKVQKQSQLSPALAAFERRLRDFCSAPPPLPPAIPAAPPAPQPA